MKVTKIEKIERGKCQRKERGGVTKIVNIEKKIETDRGGKRKKGKRGNDKDREYGEKERA